MILISHRGNIDGRIVERENHPDYIKEAITAGYDVEVDVWYIDGSWWLGHDGPQYEVRVDFFFNQKLWLHCKNHAALEKLNSFSNIKYFWHQNDDYTIISNGKILVKPGQKLLNNSICCMPEIDINGDINICYAVMTDYIKKYS